MTKDNVRISKLTLFWNRHDANKQIYMIIYTTQKPGPSPTI